MLKIFLRVFACCAVAWVAGCTVAINDPPPLTTVEAENNLNSMSVDVSGTTTNVDGIDLESVTIGDVFFTSIAYGTTSYEKVTNRSGNVSVTIGTAVVYTTVLGQTVPIEFQNISQMSTTITPERLNTVVFNQTTAGVIFQALAKTSVF
ncbi:MAG: hypothetical protein A2268_11325 [Candidatus Raymondbacteria bacterium RifOxyA12_full_50_37]|uniref:Uncharacterized protein n=1 Tax=Candidatus Raymondbacteria bacterium RIFOXYD12_FULL_49_13 TaxID=1817890 RepID=A0A1F7FAF7_UNCRA|nr:MAG: hypothetical protein A2268_11325 [Candidatus Raymondbacteria bacterium RifOxyA12_full_50_37]OGJ92364.1 MAG: hypothetical protein A2248_10450 [Candidatus Raymondbacteria bacterium RIFOXYA2_FULL_49_16]OGJ99345.1 MAG: hypothetical protein A2453_13510 [Candidatus Raymondbacteria bacterium RIFOXYC2_FULL_50_21]OGK03640.1 MAG: hypothetical protein A2519_02615 [Candidatus Raymondbacteria bacterium RIFOXYD12_FULL_49_13]OGK04824.1 MAG: hypothetical protein A2487_03645 [Candidatus Raymondbacteria 